MQVERRHQPSFAVARLHLAGWGAGPGGAVDEGGEGLVFDLAGPGRLLTRSRSRSALVQSLTATLPFRRA